MSKHILRVLNTPASKIVLAAVFVTALLFAAFGYPRTASAHCDSVQGPVVQAALQSLDKKDVKLVLPYVKPEYEAELTAAFKQAQSVRGTSPQAKELADQYFSEVAVRLHRQGEGAAYTGLSDEKVPPAIVEADKAIQTGELKGIYQLLDAKIKQGVEEKYHAVIEARENAKKVGTVEAYREQAEAELIFEKYIYELYTLSSAEGHAAEGSAHTH